jgi:hypothetical protein
MPISRSFIVLTVLAGVGLGRLVAADEPKETLTLHTPWKGERIELPPRFARAMTLKGIEEIRFAPGMFDAKSDSFFTYVFVFSVSKEQALTREMIQREMLVYYQGLSESVSKSKERSVDAGKFTFEMGEAEAAVEAPEKIPASVKVTQYTGKLKWVEPFATGQTQVLNFELQSWTDPTMARNYLFVCTSPKAPGDAEVLWKELRQIRRTFEVTGK